MSTMITTSATTEQKTSLRVSRPSFFGLVRGELFKMTRQWTTWILLILLVGIVFLPYLLSLTRANLVQNINLDPAGFLSSWVGDNLGLLRAFSGIVLLILTARMIGLEYQLGTIRVLLGRGVGRVQLLLSKLVAVAIWALLLLLLGLALNVLLSLSLLQVKAGNLDILSHADATFWHDTGIYIALIGLNMLVTILLAAALSVLGRSLAFGVSASIGWFPLDNILIAILGVVFNLTQNAVWQNVSAYLLGPNLNTLAAAVTGRDWAFGASPIVRVDGTHTVVVSLVYAAIFAFVAFGLTWKRDVKE